MKKGTSTNLFDFLIVAIKLYVKFPVRIGLLILPVSVILIYFLSQR